MNVADAGASGGGLICEMKQGIGPRNGEIYV